MKAPLLSRLHATERVHGAGNRRDCPRTKDPRCKDPSRLCKPGWLMATRAMVTGDLCAIVRVPPLVHTRPAWQSANPTSVCSSVSLRFSFAYATRRIDPLDEGQICLGNIFQNPWRRLKRRSLLTATFLARERGEFSGNKNASVRSPETAAWNFSRFRVELAKSSNQPVTPRTVLFPCFSKAEKISAG